MATKISLKQLYIKLFPFLLIAALAFEMNPRAGMSRSGAFWIFSCNYSLGAGLGPRVRRCCLQRLQSQMDRNQVLQTD